MHGCQAKDVQFQKNHIDGNRVSQIAAVFKMIFFKKEINRVRALVETAYLLNYLQNTG